MTSTRSPSALAPPRMRARRERLEEQLQATVDVFPARTRGWAATLLRHGGRRLTDTPAERAAESTWSRLRRRKVVQWGLVYVAGAWGFLQGLEYVTRTFHWPDSSARGGRAVCNEVLESGRSNDKDQPRRLRSEAI